MSRFGYHDDLTEATEEREEVGVGGLPSEGQMVLLCLDFLRDLRRSYNKEDLALAEGIDADYLSMAIHSLSRVFIRPQHLRFTEPDGNDAWMDRNKANIISPNSFPPIPSNNKKLPDLTTINQEILYSTNPNSVDKVAYTDNLNSDDWYEYDDSHISNSHRFYALNGLASGPSLKGPLALGEIAAAGLASLGARSRLDAEREMIQSPLFEQFVGAVRAKGFFKDPDTEYPREDPEEEKERQIKVAEIYDDRFRKVVAKFRSKLATKAQQQEGTLSPSNLGGPVSGNLLALSAVDRQQKRRERRTEMARFKLSNYPSTQLSPMAEASASGTSEPGGTPKASDGSQVASPEMAPRSGVNLSVVSPLTKKLAPQSPSARGIKTHNPVDLEEAERLKAEGNTFMQQKEYQGAADAYTAALKLSPSGPQSHVYFSNRAAALLSMKRFDDAILDSERSLALKPDYGKAHARLGLAHFLLGNYRQAMEAYTVSLKYEPENKSSQSYLAKAAKRLAKQEGDDEATSFSIVSEWDKSEAGKTIGTTLEEHTGRKKIMDQKEAERFKAKGNSFMANRDYMSALDAYSRALQLCPHGEQSHVYYSNRAAALCYLERYEEAEHDSEQALALNPTYGKAHARLGLSRFFMGDYEGAVDAYSLALKFDPDNAASKSYLQKALERSGRGQSESAAMDGSLSVGGTMEIASQRVKDRLPNSTSSGKHGTSAKITASRTEGIPGKASNSEKLPTTFPIEDASVKEMLRDPRMVGAGQRLMNDPEMLRMAKNAMADPSMIESMMSAVNERS